MDKSSLVHCNANRTDTFGRLVDKALNRHHFRLVPLCPHRLDHAYDHKSLYPTRAVFRDDHLSGRLFLHPNWYGELCICRKRVDHIGNRDVGKSISAGVPSWL